MELKPGSRWKSSVCDTEVVVVRPPATVVMFACGGAPMFPFGTEPPAGQKLDQANASGTQIGKRYIDLPTALEVLCVKPGVGSLSVDGRVVSIKEAKKLPSSD